MRKDEDDPSTGFRVFHGTPTRFDCLCLECMRDSSTAQTRNKKNNKGVRVNARQMGISQREEKYKPGANCQLNTAERMKLCDWLNDQLGDSKGKLINLQSYMKIMYPFKTNGVKSRSWYVMTVETFNSVSAPSVDPLKLHIFETALKKKKFTFRRSY